MNQGSARRNFSSLSTTQPAFRLGAHWAKPATGQTDWGPARLPPAHYAIPAHSWLSRGSAEWAAQLGPSKVPAGQYTTKWALRANGLPSRYPVRAQCRPGVSFHANTDIPAQSGPRQSPVMKTEIMTPKQGRIHIFLGEGLQVDQGETWPSGGA